MLPDTDVRQFQRTHTNHLGLPLAVDGVRGPQTQWAEAIATLHPARHRVIQRALSHVGVCEDPPGSNRGVRIDAWLDRCNVQRGNPWCAAFASWCLYDGTAIAGAVRLGESFAATGEPLPGDLMWYRTDRRGRGHIGIVIGVGRLEVMTVEGNVDSRVGVWRRARGAVHFSRPVLDTSGVCAGIIESVPQRPVTAEGTR